jgi:hypothetical protein
MVDGQHEKPYLIMNHPLHEPGQGNQDCGAYRYEFHIGRDRAVYRIEFRTPEPKRLPVRRTLWAVATSCSGSSPAKPKP